MAGKTRIQKKKRAKIRKREHELLNQKPKKILVVGEKKTTMSRMAKQEQEELALAQEQAKSEAETLLGKDGEPEPTALATLEKPEPEEPFDPASIVANILKKKEE